MKTVPYDKISPDMNKYAHNSGAIGVTLGNGTVQSLADTLEQIINSVDSLRNNLVRVIQKMKDILDYMVQVIIQIISQ